MGGQRSVSGGAALASVAVIVGLWVVRVGIHLPGGYDGSTSSVFADSSRALGIAALVLAGAALPIGLAVGRRMVHGGRAAQVRALHRALALWALAAIGLHVLALVGATALGPSVVRLLVPFAWPYRTVATGLGVLAAWVIVALGLSYYQRRRIGARRWRIAHRFVVVGLALAIALTVGGG
jgi:methionine sulfoxide reductase heme-binding subunit